jgi:DNA-binding transcriptional MerR regulator
MKKNKNHLRIGQLAKMAGVSPSTIKHYVNQGLLPRPMKTSKNMAYYDKSCIDKIRLIKQIQKEKFLPLDVIKRLIDSGESYTEELKLGKAILKSHKITPHSKPIRESQIERHTGYSLEKIRILEKERLVLPHIRNSVKEYDDVDCKIIEIMKFREELGVPFDYSLEFLRIYRDAIEEAVQRDINLFVRTFISDLHNKAITLMTESDETLDRFMVLYRNKMLRTLSEGAIKELNDLSRRLSLLNMFPVAGEELPSDPPDEIPLRIIYFFCRGELEKIIALGTENPDSHDLAAPTIIASLLLGKVDSALRMVEEKIPRPSVRTLDNTAAVLAYLFSIGRASGLSVPMHHANKILAYLHRIEISDEDNTIIRFISRYICGAVYILLPDILETCKIGIAMLTALNQEMKKQRWEIPEWLRRTFSFEIFPEIEIRINRFLAEGYQNLGKREEALSCLNRIIDIADPESDHAQWTRMERLKIQ